MASNENKLKSIAHVLWQALIPGLVVWLILDPSLNLLGKNFKNSITIGYMFLIALLMLFYTLIATWIAFKLKWHQQEQFIYSTIVMLEFIILYLTSLLNLVIFWKFIIAIIIAVIGTMLLTVIVAVITNHFNKTVIEN